MSVSLQDLLAEKERRMMEAQQSPPPANQQFELQDLLAEKQRRQQQEEATPQRSLTRFIGEQLSKGLINLTDVLPFAGLMNAEIPNPKGGPSSRIYPSMTEDVLPAAGIDINSEPEDTAARRMAGHGLRAAPAALLGGPQGLIKNALMATLSGTGSGALQEIGVPSPVADIASIAGTAALGSGARRIANNIKSSLSGKEREVAKFLQKNMSESERLAALEKLESAKPYKRTGFESSTAGETQSPSLSHLHRLQYEAPGSELPEFGAKGTKKITQGFRGHAPKEGKFKNNANIREGIEEHLKESKKLRHEATNPLYEELSSDERVVNPTHLKKFFNKNKNVSGKLEADLNSIKSSVKPIKSTRPSQEYPNLPAEGEKISSQDYKKLLENQPQPKGKQTTVGRLVNADMAMTAEIEDLTNARSTSRARLYKDAKKAIDKDLQGAPEYKELRSTYREMSKPISEIEKHPHLKDITRKKSEHYTLGQKKIINKIFNDNSYENVTSLEKSLGKNNPVMERVREGAMGHFYDSITNAGNEGGVRTLSLPKMNKFLNKHDETLKGFLTPEQKGFVKEARRALKSQHAEKTAGAGQNSATAGRLRTAEHIKKEFRLENEPMWTTNLKAQTYRLGRSTPFVKAFFEDMAEKRAEELSSVLNKVLMDKDLAKKMMRYDFKSAKELSEFMSDTAKLGVASHISDKEEEEE